MDRILNPDRVSGIGSAEREMLGRLLDVFRDAESHNKVKERYYEGKISLSEVNLGIAIPSGMRGLEIGCSWGAKTVDVLASRSMFDGFVGENGEEIDEMTQIVVDNNMISEYSKACRDELKIGCSFATLSADDEIGCRIRFHSTSSAAAIWDGEKNRIAYGMAIIETKPTNADRTYWKPTLLRLDTEEAVWLIKRIGDGDDWEATRIAHKMGRPLMEPLIYNPTSSKPFGQSRLKEPIRRLIQGYVRTIANATIGLEFSTAPQKYLLGVSDDQFDAVVNDKFRQYVGSILTATVNPETGEKPTYGQLQQGNISPHVEMIRILATQFSAATGLTVTDTGVVNDANPTSSDAILAQSQTLVLMAEQLNAGNGDALRNIAQMALAIANDVTLEELTDTQKSIVAHFKNPAMPSVAVTADAAIKIASARPEFAGTDTFLEMIGFSQADVRRIKGQEARQRGLNVLEELNV